MENHQFTLNDRDVKAVAQMLAFARHHDTGGRAVGATRQRQLSEAFATMADSLEADKNLRVEIHFIKMIDEQPLDAE